MPTRCAPLILWKMTSRRVLALFTTKSTPPKQSIAVYMIFCVPDQLDTQSVLMVALPSAASIWALVSAAGPADATSRAIDNGKSSAEIND